MAVLEFVHDIPYPKCISHFAGSPALSWTYYVEVYMTAAKHGVEALAKHILNELETFRIPGYDDCLDFFNAVRVAFPGPVNADDPLRILLAHRFFRRMPMHPRLSSHPELGALLRSCPKFAVLMLGEVEDKRVCSITVFDDDGMDTTVRGSLTASVGRIFEVTAGRSISDEYGPWEVLRCYEDGSSTQIEESDWQTPFAEVVYVYPS